MLDALRGDGFCLAGGAALVAVGVSQRPTRDIDAFTARMIDVGAAAERASVVLRDAGFDVIVERSDSEFATLLVTAAGRRRSQFRFDLGIDHIAWPPAESALGPTLSERELAANKVLALFGRVQPRDLVDLESLATRQPVADMLADAATKDLGFDRLVLAEMLDLVLRRPDPEWPPGTDVDRVRAFGRSLRDTLSR